MSDTEFDENTRSKTIRKKLKDVEYDQWRQIQRKGRFMCLFSDSPRTNKEFHRIKALTPAECTDVIKMVGDVAPVRRIKGRSMDGKRVDIVLQLNITQLKLCQMSLDSILMTVY